MSKRTFVCRCEDVTLPELEHAVARGMTTIEEVKRYTGLGTGPCQGKECMVALARFLADRDLVDPATLVPFTARPPAEPVTFGALASMEDPDAEGGPA
jgi:sarcosine oxidase subunit beta